MRSERPASRRGPLRPPRRKAAPAPSLAATPQPTRATRATRAARGASAVSPAASEKLQKVLAQTGLGSRRAMEAWIESGRVSVNGKVAGIGTRVTPADHLRVDGREVRVSRAADTPRVLMYHKPEGEIVTRDDPQGRETVFSRLPGLRGARWLSVGRLDVSTSGLLLFTTSGALANQLMHPRFGIEREYAVRIFGRLTPEHKARLLEGVELDDGLARCAHLEDEGANYETPGSNHWYRLVMTEGRNRVVRRLFEAVGFTVSRLIRVRFGPMALPSRLKRGQFEELKPEDVRKLLAWIEQSDIPRESGALRAAKHARS